MIPKDKRGDRPQERERIFLQNKRRRKSTTTMISSFSLAKRQTNVIIEATITNLQVKCRVINVYVACDVNDYLPTSSSQKETL
jgi:hypothetical protein